MVSRKERIMELTKGSEVEMGGGTKGDVRCHEDIEDWFFTQPRKLRTVRMPRRKTVMRMKMKMMKMIAMRMKMMRKRSQTR